MKTVMFYCMRHGHRKDGGDELSQLGFKQVEASALAHLTGINFDVAYYSGLTRAKQTAGHALASLGQPNVAIMKEEGFGFTWFELDPAMPGPKGTPPDYRFIGEYMHKGYPLAIATRGRVWQTLLERTADLLSMPHPEVVNALVASHSPTIETAVPEPNSFPRLQLADICVYEVTVDDDGNAAIKNARYMSAPAVAND